jgi:hypothetical protein
LSELNAMKSEDGSKRLAKEEKIKEKGTHLVVPDPITTTLPMDEDVNRPRRISHRRCRYLVTLRNHRSLTSRSTSPLRFDCSLQATVDDPKSRGFTASTSPDVSSNDCNHNYRRLARLPSTAELYVTGTYFVHYFRT